MEKTPKYLTFFLEIHGMPIPGSPVEPAVENAEPKIDSANPSVENPWCFCHELTDGYYMVNDG